MSFTLVALLVAAAPDAALLDDTRLHAWTLHVRSADDYARLDEPDFPWVRADVTIDGVRVGDVALRRKSARLARAGSAKTPYKLSFTKFVKRRRFQGLQRVVLNTGAQDPSQLREKLSYDLFRAAGCPASRAAFAEVHLQIAGGPGERVGLYTVVEDVGEAFLESRFGDDGGTLLEVRTGGDVFGVGMSEEMLGHATKVQRGRGGVSRLHALVNALGVGPDAITRHLDVDLFLRCLAVNTALVNLDSYAGTGHNFYVYDDPARGKLVYIPWDHDQSFGMFVRGPAEAALDWDVWSPAIGSKRLIAVVLAHPPWRTRYAEHLHALATGPFTPFAMSARITRLAGVIDAAGRRDTNRRFAVDLFVRNRVDDVLHEGPRVLFPVSFGLTSFVERRQRSIIEQLVGLRIGQPLPEY
ncbi:CotH kinase family protein [Myxococcota bacterium]|nr:CotH kinase family protein [Myxococcota bacterium]